jgi:hypothetical protein
VEEEITQGIAENGSSHCTTNRSSSSVRSSLTCTRQTYREPTDTSFAWASVLSPEPSSR